MTNTTSRPVYTMKEYNGTDYNEYSEYIYMAFDFEHPIYLFIWEILVVISVVFSTLLILTLMRKKLRSVTSYIFCAIAMSDILTGLVTLPTYIMVYQRLSRAEDHVYDEASTGANISDPFYEDYTWLDYSYHADNTSNITITPSDSGAPPAMDAYLLNKQLCEAFMISKFVLSKMFHTISIWLTVFLGIQRCLSVLMPFSARAWFTKKKIIALIVSIVCFALLLHGFHIFNDKTKDVFCSWTIEKDCSDGTCIQVWATLICRHMIPCIVLTVTTVLMVRKLRKSSFQTSRTKSVKKFQHGSEVIDETRQVTLIVTAIVIVFLVTEVPYGVFLFYIAVIKDNYNVEMNRTFHEVYEITMVVSFNANIIIYTSFNRRFKKELMHIICCWHGKPEVHSSSQRPSSSQNQPATEMSTFV